MNGIHADVCKPRIFDFCFYQRPSHSSAVTTKVLRFEGLRGDADYNKDGQVVLGERIPYLSEQVRRETRNAQSPTVAGKFDPALNIAR
jgi:hypothetical protein